jgi:GNAT superfamily N-acetyltransferase
MHEVRIRPAGSLDIPHILHHRQSMYMDMGRGDPASYAKMLEATEAYLRAAMASGAYTAWMAETAEGRVIGGAGVAISPWPGSPDDPSGRRALVLNVYTEPEFRRRGIARRIMETAIAWCREQGLGSVSLHASDVGRTLYESLGFRQTNEMRLYLK